MKKHIIYICLIIAGIYSCNTEEVEVYSSPRYLFFPDSSKGLDSVEFSFSHFPGTTTHDASFYIALTGIPANEALEYKLEVVDSLTTAEPADYNIPEGLLFPANKYLIIKHDSLFYVVNKIGEYPFLNIPLFNQSINHLYLVSPCKAAFIPVAISVAFTALSKNESI